MNVLTRIPVVVLGKVWLDGDNDPPTLECRLSSGAYLKVGYDYDYRHPLVWAAADKEADFVSVPLRDCGLGMDELSPLVDEVASATEAYWSNWRAEYASDENNFGDR